MGLVSLVLARMVSIGIGKDVNIVATDVDEQVLNQLRGNIELSAYEFSIQNSCTYLLFLNADHFEKSIIASKLDWEIASNLSLIDDQLSKLNLSGEMVEFEPRSIEEWERSVLPEGERARLILGADIVLSFTPLPWILYIELIRFAAIGIRSDSRAIVSEHFGDSIAPHPSLSKPYCFDSGHYQD